MKDKYLKATIALIALGYVLYFNYQYFENNKDIPNIHLMTFILMLFALRKK